MNIITIKKEDADYWESLLKEESLKPRDRGLQENAILAKWSVQIVEGVTACLKVGSGTHALSAWMEWNRGGALESTDTRKTLLGEWPSPEGDPEDNVKVIMAGADPGEPETKQDNPLLTFEEGRRLAESGEAKPDYAGDILFDKKYGVFPLEIKDHEVLVTNQSILLNKWDFCMGVLSGLGYGDLSSNVFFSDVRDMFSVKIRLVKKAADCASLENFIGRGYCRESLLNARALRASLNLVWDALKKDVPPRLRGTVIGTLLTMRQLVDSKEGLVKLFDAYWNVFIFEIHRGVLLRLDEDGHVIGVGYDALFIPAPLTDIPEN